MSVAPFVIFGLPRSRTNWLSRFLTYGPWYCGHEELRHMRSLDDVKAWLSQSYTGTAETAAASFWRLLLKYRPDARVAVVRRPVAECVESLMRLNLHGAGAFDRAALAKALGRMDRKLDQVERRMPNAISIRAEDLSGRDARKKIFEHCLQIDYDELHGGRLAKQNIQCHVASFFRYEAAFRPQLVKLSAMARHAMFKDLAIKRPVEQDGLTIRRESFETFLADGAPIFADHSMNVGEAPYSFETKNIPLMRALERLGALQIITARSNGRLFGYLMSVISPSLEERDRKVAIHHAFFASDDMPGLGLKLQRAALRELNESGVDEAFFRAGVRGAGPKMGSLYKRLGAEYDGEIYRMNLRN